MAEAFKIMIKTYLRGFVSEIKKELVIYFQHKAVFVTDFLVYSVLYSALVFLKAGTSLGITYGVGQVYSKVLLFLGYIIWMQCSQAINIANSSILKESNNGQLYAKLTGVVPIEILFFAQLISSIFTLSVQIIPLILISIIFGIFSGVVIQSIILILLIIFIAIIGMYGLSLLFASFSMINKRLSRISSLLTTILLFSSNALTYNESLGKALKYFPINFAIHTSRELFVGKPLQIIEFIIFLSICILFVIIGYIIFNISKNKGKLKGTILNY